MVRLKQKALIAKYRIINRSQEHVTDFLNALVQNVGILEIYYGQGPESVSPEAVPSRTVSSVCGIASHQLTTAPQSHPSAAAASAAPAHCGDRLK